jgi:hypothetical protein
MSNVNSSLDLASDDSELLAARELGKWRSRTRSMFLIPSVSLSIGMTIWGPWLLGIGCIALSIYVSKAMVSALATGKADELARRYDVPISRMDELVAQVARL